MYTLRRALLPSLRTRFALGLLLWALLPLAFAAAPQRILILHSFSRDFSPYSTIVTAFRSEMEREAHEPIAFYEAALDSGQVGSEEDTRPMVAFLRERFIAQAPDLVVCIEVPAALFYLQNRGRLFRDTPLLIVGSEQRLTRKMALRPRDAVVGSQVDIPSLAHNILTLLPETKTIAVVIGASELERFWAKEAQREFARLGDRVRFVFWNDLSLQEVRKRVGMLPRDSAVLYSLFIVDAAGIPHEHEEALAQLHAATNAPIFGVFEEQLGKGIVGGPLLSQQQMGLQSARVARALLSGGTPAEDTLRPVPFSVPAFDWEELQRWRIEERRLPAGSQILNQPPTLWQAHKSAIAAGITIVAIQAVLIFALLVQRARRRRAEEESMYMSGRLLTAHEDERRRIARELHDDVTQRLARLAIDAAQWERGRGTPIVETAPQLLREELVRLSEDVHALSYRLHPSMLDDLGLVEALRAECERVARREPLKLDLSLHEIPYPFPADAALCLFRIAQEALRNVTRHAKASTVAVLLAPSHGGVRLAVQDNGSGFDPVRVRQLPSLGHASMRERVRLVHGTLNIDSSPGHGTRITAWVPVSKT